MKLNCLVQINKKKKHLLKEQIISVINTHRVDFKCDQYKHCNHKGLMDVLSVVIVLKYISIYNHHIIQLNYGKFCLLIQYGFNETKPEMEGKTMCKN